LFIPTLLAFSALVAACAEPECPFGTYKTRDNICRRVDAGTASEDAAVLAAEGGSDAEAATHQEDGAVAVQSDAGMSVFDAAATTMMSVDSGATAQLDATAGSDTGMAAQDAGTADTGTPQDAAPTSCMTGYVLKNGACQDVDECFEGTHGCHPTSTCKNTAGSFDCTCPAGYSGGTSAGFACAPRIAVGTDHTCVLLSSGQVQCWGKNSAGQIGDGTQTDRTVPTLVAGLSDAAVIIAGTRYSCAVLRDATVRCWGNNMSGALGDGSMMNRASPVAVQGLERVVALSAYGGHACAVVRDGTVKCWGANDAGQLGTGASSTTPSLTPVGVAGLTTAANVFVGPSQTCAIYQNGSAQCWGNGFLGNGTSSSLTRVNVAVPNNIKSMAIGPFHACALLATGSVYCWGPPALVGNGVTTPGDQTPAIVTGTLGKAIGLGVYSTCVLRNDGTIVWWDAGLTPTPVSGLSNVVAFSSLGTNVCEILEDGTVTCWTLNNATLTAPNVVGGLDLW
jgi:alpha-tubulin suppressor-like RCC1 family protein